MWTSSDNVIVPCLYSWLRQSHASGECPIVQSLVFQPSWALTTTAQCQLEVVREERQVLCPGPLPLTGCNAEPKGSSLYPRPGPTEIMFGRPPPILPNFRAELLAEFDQRFLSSL